MLNSFTSLLANLLAQTSYSEPQFGIGQLVLFIILYAVGAFFCQKIFEKCGVENSWFAWIPVLNTYANFKAGNQDNPVLWTILSFVPCVNIVAIVMLVISWVRICNKLGKSPWLLLFCLLPLGAFGVLGYLAFG